MRGIEPAQQILHVSVSVLVALAERSVPNQPSVRNKVNDAINNIRRDPPGHLRVYLLKSTGTLEEDVVFDHRERGSATFAVVLPCVVEVEGRSMIDKPESSVPDKHVCVARRTVDVGHVRVEPDDRRGELRVGPVSNRIKRYGTGQIVEGEIETSTRPDQRLYLWIGLSPGKFRVEFNEDNLRHRQSYGAGDSPRHKLSDECFGPLTCAAELEHIHAIIIGFDDSWQRSALAQWGDIPCSHDCSQAHHLSS